MLEYNNLQNTRVYFVGGAGSGLTYIAVLCTENGDVLFNIICGLDENDDMKSKTENRSYKLYSYKEMKALADRGNKLQFGQLDGFSKHSANDAKLPYALIAAGVVLAIAAAIISVSVALAVKKKKKASENAE